MWESACWPRDQTDLRLGWDRKGRSQAASLGTLDCLDPWLVRSAVAALVALVAWAASAAWVASAALVAGPAYPWVLAGGGKEAAGGRSAGRGRDPRRDRWGFRRRACRHAHRTPVLYSRNQSRTNRAL